MSLSQRLFGPSSKEMWRKLSAETGGRYHEGGFWKGDKVEIDHGEWTLTLDKYTVSTGKVTIVYTRMRAPYVNPDGFRFKVYRRGVFSDLGKKLGMQDVEVGHEAFDRDFIIKGTDENKLRKLFANKRIRELIDAQPEIQFMVRDDEGWFATRFPDGADELVFTVTGIIKDVERLKLLYALFAETLDELCRMGSAYKHAPGVEL